MHEPSCTPTSADPAANDHPPAASITPAASPPAQYPPALGDASDHKAFIAHLDALIRSGDHVETPNGPLPIGDPDDDPSSGLTQEMRLLHEKDLLAAVLAGSGDNRHLWGQFRTRVGLRFHEPVPDSLWSSPAHRLIAAEIDASFRGDRDGRLINGEALRHGVRERAIAGRWGGCLDQLETALAELIAWQNAASPLDFPIACEIFQAAKARQIFYPTLRRLLSRQHKDVAIDAELRTCLQAVQEALALRDGRIRHRTPVLSARHDSLACLALAGTPLSERPKPISTGIPSFDIDMRGGVIPGQGENLWVLAARSGIGKTTLAIAAAMGLATNGASILFFSCELSQQAILSRLLANYCRHCVGIRTPLYSSNDLEGRGKAIAGDDLVRLQHIQECFQRRVPLRGVNPEARLP